MLSYHYLNSDYPFRLQSGLLVSVVPLPGALPLFLSVLAGMGALRWWRRKIPAEAGLMGILRIRHCAVVSAMAFTAC